MTPEQQKFYDIKNTPDYKVIGDDLDYKVFVDDSKKQIILQFKESDSREDWINNFSFLPWPIKLAGKVVWTTHGYARAYASACSQPLFDTLSLLSEHPGYGIVIRGWSFGSAMSKIAVRHFANKGYRIAELTTYGDVKCWLNPFYSNKKYCKRIREYVQPNDAVTYCVPFFYHRDVKCSVGRRLNLIEIFKVEKYHAHYEDCDYSKWEDD